MNEDEAASENQQQAANEPRNVSGGAAPQSAPERVFVIRDMTIRDIEDNLLVLQDGSLAGFDVKVAGFDEGSSEIWRNYVKPEIDKAAQVLALVDLPNANVGFEVGYAFAMGKGLTLLRKGAGTNTAMSGWLTVPPFVGWFVNEKSSLSAWRTAIQKRRRSKPILRSPTIDRNATLVLCPSGDHTEGLREKLAAFFTRHPSFRSPKAHAWNLNDIAELLDDVQRVVWLVLPCPEDDVRDGIGNATNAVIAGVAEALEIELVILERLPKALTADGTPPRRIADIMPKVEPVESLDATLARLEKLAQPTIALPKPVALIAAYRSHLRKRHDNLVPFFWKSEDHVLSNVYVDIAIATDERRLEERGGAEAHKNTWTLKEILEAKTPTLSDRPGHWLILGEPGAGKSTICRHLCYDLGKESADESTPLPLFISLARFARSAAEPFAFVEHDLCGDDATHELRGLAKRLESIASTHGERLWILFDGLDEVPGEARVDVSARLASFARAHPRCRIVVTCRPAGYSSPIAPNFRLASVQPLIEHQQRELLTRWIASKAEALMKRIVAAPAIADLARNPLFLTLMAKVFVDPSRPTIPVTRVELYRESIKLLLEHGFAAEPRGVEDRDAAIEILRPLAFALHEVQVETWEEGELNRTVHSLIKADRDLFVRLKGAWSSIKKFLDDIAHHSGIIAAHDGPGTPWRFLHRSLREYLTAEHLALAGAGFYERYARSIGSDLGDQDDDVESEDDVRARENATAHWGETIALLASIVSDPSAKHRLIELLCRSNVDLAKRALVSLEGFDPTTAFAYLTGLQDRSGEAAWDGDDLRRLVARWRLDGLDDGKIRDVVLAYLSHDMSLDELAFRYYALESNEVASIDATSSCDVGVGQAAAHRHRRHR